MKKRMVKKMVELKYVQLQEFGPVHAYLWMMRGWPNSRSVVRREKRFLQRAQRAIARFQQHECRHGKGRWPW